MLRWEGSLKILCFQPPCHGHQGQGHLAPAPSKLVAQIPIQAVQELFQEWGTQSFSGQAVPVPHYPQSQEFLPNANSEAALFHFKNIPPFLTAILVNFEIWNTHCALALAIFTMTFGIFVLVGLF